MANEQPANKTKAKAAFLKQANHFARLGTATDQDVVTLIDSIEAMLASVLKKPISIQINGVHADLEHTITPPSAEQYAELKKAFDEYQKNSNPTELRIFVEGPPPKLYPPMALPIIGDGQLLSSFSKQYPIALPADIHIDLMGLSVRAMDALNKAGVSQASQIAALTKAQLSEIKGIGTKTIPSIIDALQKHGLTLVADHV